MLMMDTCIYALHGIYGRRAAYFLVPRGGYILASAKFCAGIDVVVSCVGRGAIETQIPL